VEPISDCRVHHPRINAAIDELKRAAMDAGVKGYEEAKNGQPSQGELRYLQMSVERQSGKVQLVLVWNVAMYKDAEQTLPRLVKRLKGRPDLWHSVTVNFQTSDSNAIFNYNAKAWKLLWGPPALREVIGRASFFFKPQIFRQANLDAFERGIVPAVEKYVFPGSSVAELYSGICVMGLNVAHKASQVLCSDSNEYVDEVFDRCADSLAAPEQEKVFYENLSAEDAVEQGKWE
jgi:tRNA/tmRNA/rRNA uracil-C5-methylase (TrmA/RlmC/RlmD family)